MARHEAKIWAPLLLALTTGCYTGFPVQADTDGVAEDDATDDDDADDDDASGSSPSNSSGGTGGASGSETSPEGSGEPTGSGTSGDDPTTGDPSDTAEPGDESSTGVFEEPPSELAVGIAWDSIEMNQGVLIEVVRDGGYLDASQRNAELIAGRPTLVRGFWTLASDFAPRSLEARLLVQDGDDVQVFSDVRDVAGPPDRTQLEGGFLWEIPAGTITDTSEFAFEIAETNDTSEGAAADGGARVPADGFANAAVADGPHKLEVVIVPLRYNAGGGLEPDLSASARSTLENALYDQNPITELDITYRSVVDYGAAVNSGGQLGDILGFLSNLKSNDGAAPEVYYAGLVNIGCFVVGCGNAGTTGIGYVPSASQNSSFQRVSANVWYSPEGSSGTVVHEVGHNQGLSHIACPGGGAAGTDPSYPYANGELNGWGWGPKSGDIYGSNTHDYMSYCGPSWVSDWTWEKTRSRVEALSGWSAAPIEPNTRLVVGHTYPDGTQSWFEFDGQPLNEPSSSTISFASPDGVVSVDAVEGDLSDGGGRWVVAEVPVTATGFSALQWQHEGVTDTVQASAFSTF